jgi:hypothetical protein
MLEEDGHYIDKVGIVLSRQMKSSFLEGRAVSEGLMIARLKCKHRNLTIAQVYAPTEDGKEGFLKQTGGCPCKDS